MSVLCTRWDGSKHSFESEPWQNYCHMHPTCAWLVNWCFVHNIRYIGMMNGEWCERHLDWSFAALNTSYWTVMCKASHTVPMSYIDRVITGICVKDFVCSECVRTWGSYVPVRKLRRVWAKLFKLGPTEKSIRDWPSNKLWALLSPFTGAFWGWGWGKKGDGGW